jgi:hypothetical protein
MPLCYGDFTDLGDKPPLLRRALDHVLVNVNSNQVPDSLEA